MSREGGRGQKVRPRKEKGCSRVSASAGPSAFTTTKPEYSFGRHQREVWNQGDRQ